MKAALAAKTCQNGELTTLERINNTENSNKWATIRKSLGYSRIDLVECKSVCNDFSWLRFEPRIWQIMMDYRMSLTHLPTRVTKISFWPQDHHLQVVSRNAWCSTLMWLKLNHFYFSLIHLWVVSLVSIERRKSSMSISRKLSMSRPSIKLFRCHYWRWIEYRKWSKIEL